MASSRYGKGSWVYKILIVLLTAALAGSIIYPKTLWEEEARNTEESHKRMTNIYNAALFYQRFHGDFTDSLELLIEFIKTDSTYHAYVDTAIGKPLDRFTMMFDSLKQGQLALQELIPQIDPADSAALDSFTHKLDLFRIENRYARDKLESLRDEMKLHPGAPLNTFDRALAVVERKDFFLEYDIVQNMVAQNRTQDALDASRIILSNYDVILDNLRKTKSEIPLMYALADSMYRCPTTHRPFRLSVEYLDSNRVIREVIVESPIDSAYIDSINHDFLLSTIGALTIKSHGRIKGGEKSWETIK